MKKFVLEHKGFASFLFLQLCILLWSLTGMFGKLVNMELTADNLEIYDEKVVVNDDQSVYITGRNDAETYGRWIVGSEPFDLKSGMYEVSINYWSLLYDTEVGGNCEDKTGVVQIVRPKETEDKLCFNDLAFKDGWNHQETRLWIRNVSGEQNLQVKVNFYGVGELRIDSIVIKELPIWHLMKLIAWLILFILTDAAYYYFFVSAKSRNKAVVAVILFGIVFGSLPLFTDSLFWGHDMDFHLDRILALADGLASGHLFVPIQTEVLNGYGYATPLFYSQLFLYIPAILYNLAVPMQVCYQIYAIMINIGTALIAYFSFQGIVKNKEIAATGTALYMLSAYRITNLYVRAAVGEYTAMMFLPLVAYGFFRVFTGEERKLCWKDYFPIVLGLSGLIESHVLSCELSALFILIVCIVNFRKMIQPKRFLTLVKAAVLTVLVNMAYLIPFLDSMQMDLRVNSEKINQIQVHGTYLLQLLGVFQVSYGHSNIGVMNDIPVALGFSLVLGMILFLICCSKKHDWNIPRDEIFNVGLTCSAFAIASMILSTRFFPWDGLEGISKVLAKVLCMVQFPWRYLSVATVFAVIATMAGLLILGRIKGEKLMRILCGGLCLISVMTTGLLFAVYTDSIKIERVYGDADVMEEVSSGEYVLNGTIEGNLRWRKTNADTNYVTVDDYTYEGGVTTFDCSNTADTEMALELPLLNYDNYHAYELADGTELGIMNGSDNRVSIAVPAHFDSSIQVVYEFPLIWKLSYLISAVSVTALAVVAFLGRRKEKRD